ncbi:hypothetical protein ACWEVP_36910 [Amycolatopsis sp. NPDC003865]
MPEGNPLVVDAKKDPDGPGAFTAGNGDYGWAGGIGIAESSMDAFNGIKDGDWVSGGLGMLSLAGEIAGAAIDPFGYLMSSVASFLMEHVQPLKDMLDSVAGNPPVIQSYADTWGNVSKALGERKTDFDNAVKNGTTGWTGAGADAYRKFAAEHSEALSGAATVAGAISTVTMIMGQVVSFVRETVRQLIADLVGKLIAWVMEEVFSLGFGTPVVVAQASAAIAKWGKKIGELLKKLTDTIRKVSPLLSKLVDVFEKIAKVFGKVLGKVSGLDGLKVKEGGFVHKIPKEGGGVHTRAHGGDGAHSGEGEGSSGGDGSDGSHGGEGDSSHSGDGDSSHGGEDSSTGSGDGRGDSPSSDPTNTDPGSRRSSSREGSGSPDGDSSPSHTGDGDGAPSHTGDDSPSRSGDSSSSPTRSPSGDSSPSPTRGSDSAPSHTGDSGPSPTRGGDSTPSHTGDNSPSHTGDSTPSRAGDNSPSPTRGGDSTPSHTRGSDSTPSHTGDNTPSRASDNTPSPTRGSDSTPSHTGDSTPSRASDSTPSPTRGSDSAPSHTGDSTPSRGGDSSPSPARGGDSTPSHAGTDSPSNAAPPRADGTTSASGTAPAAPRTGDPGTLPSPRGGDGAAVPSQGGAPMMGGGGGMPPGGGPGGGGLGGGSPRTGGGWTGTPGSPGAHSPHVDAPGRPRTGGDLPGGRPRTPDAPAPAARGFGPGTHGPDTHAPGNRPGGPHSPDGGAPGHPHENTPHENTPHENTSGHHEGDGGAPHHEPLTPDEVNARHSESTPSGSSYHAGDPDMGDLPHRVHPDPDGRYTVDVHVTPDGHARIGDRLYTPEEFADVLRRNGDYDGRPIRLIGCDASSNDFAHRLSRELDTEVLAPTRPAWTDSNGRVFSSDYEIGPDGRMRPRIPPDGEWNAHQPDGSTHRAGDDGFAPGTHDRAASADTARARGEEPGWQDRPGPDGRTPRENIADPEYIKKHYYRRPTEHGEELVINHRHANVIPPPPQLDLVDGQPRFKSDRPPAESLGFDESRSSTHPPQRTPEHEVTPEGHEPATGHDQAPGQHEPGEVPDTRNWRETDYDRIDDRVHDRQVAQDEYHDTPKDADDWVDKHNARNDASERLGEEASGHALRDRLHRDFSASFPGEDFDVRPHPDAPEGSHRYQIVDADGNVRAEITPRHPIDGGKPGAGNFDHIWEVDYKNGGEPHYIVHEAKGPGGQPSTHYDRVRDRTFQQGHPEYFDYLVRRMEKTDPDLADALERAKLEHRLDYVEVRARVDESGSTHVNTGYDYKPYNGYGYQSPLPAPPAE